jgi:hypothetical protein
MKAAMRAAQRTGIRVAITAAIWLVIMLRLSQPYWLVMPEGRTWGVADDVYITADYARTFAMGQGPLWYPGAPRVEGFSSPLWMLILTPFHWLPGVSERGLGLYVLTLCALLLVATAWVVGHMLEPIFERTAGGRARPTLVWVFTVLAPLSAAALSAWAAGGFEVAPVALFSVLSFREALEPVDRLRERRLGLLAGLAFCMRMDAVLSCAPALVLAAWKLRKSRRFLVFVGCFAVPAVLMLVSRRLYFGDWLPNTYYLKMVGWPLKKRWGAGLFQNILTLEYYLAVGIPLVAVSLRALAPADRPYLLGLLAPVLTVLYSTNNGGDFAWIALGYDRHSAPALPLLVFTLGAVLFSAQGRILRPVVGVLAVLLGLGPVLTHMEGLNIARDQRLLQVLDPTFEIGPDPFLTLTILDARALRHVTRPGARIAVCAAGAMIYFSDRGGVDILGKNDAYVAHLPAAELPGKDSRCFRGFAPSGHNKEDMPGIFARRMPELSFVKPPSDFYDQYVSFLADGRPFFGLRDSRKILWNKVTDIKPL